MSYCKRCQCEGCEKRRHRAERDIVERREIERRVKERNKERDQKWESTIGENHFNGMHFQPGFRSKNLVGADSRFSVRLANVLYQNGINTVDDVLNFSERRFMRLRNMGKVAFIELIEFLRAGLKGESRAQRVDHEEPSQWNATDRSAIFRKMRGGQ